MPSKSETDVDFATFNESIDKIAGAITQCAMSVLETNPASDAVTASEVVMLAALKLAALSAFTGNVRLDDAQESFRSAMSEVMRKVSTTGLRPQRSLNS
jgi:hypothetical protein